MIIITSLSQLAESNPPDHFQNFVPLDRLLFERLKSVEAAQRGLREIRATLLDKLGPSAIGRCVNAEEAFFGEFEWEGRMVTALKPEIAKHEFDTEGRWYMSRWWIAFQNADAEVVYKAIVDVVGPLKDATRAVA